MGEAKEIWKRLFFVLLNNTQPDDSMPSMWAQFKTERLKESELRIVIESISDLLSDGVKGSLSRLLSDEEKTCKANLLYAMQTDPSLKDDFWYLLFRAVRDRDCRPIDDSRRLRINEGGETKEMTMQGLEEKFRSENKDNLKSQTSIPDQLIHEDLIDAFLNTSSVEQELKRSYELKLSETMMTLGAENPKWKKKEVEKQAEAQAKKEVKSSSEAKALQKRMAMKAEHVVQKSIKRAMEEFNIPVYIFRGVNTYDDVGRFLESFGLKMSKLKAFKSGAEAKTLECEHDIATVALLPCGPLVSFTQVTGDVFGQISTSYSQVKTNEANTPWDPKPEDQKVGGKLFKDGVEQLERDVLRFLELTPDIPMASVMISTNIAFPLATESSDRALTKEVFKDGNASLLLEGLGVPMEVLQHPQRRIATLTAAHEKTFEEVVCRYLGAHSQVLGKIPLDRGVKALELAVKGTESGFQAQSSIPEIPEAGEAMPVRKAIAEDALMKDIRSAVAFQAQHGNKSHLKNPKIPLKDLKVDKERFLKQTSTKTFPLFGYSVITAVLRAVDEEIAHQGAQAILDFLNRQNYVFYDKDGSALDHNTEVTMYVQKCLDCSEVLKIKSKLPPPSGRLLQIPKAMETQLLLFADRRHQGYAAAYKRVKTWVDFPDFKRKIQEHTSGCFECGKRSALLFLSPQQRKAIGSRHHLKFITGHYGSGKTTVGQILCRQELIKFGRKQIFYICFSQHGDGQGLREWVEKTNFGTFLNRKECCERFNTSDSDDNIKMMENIVEKVPPHTAILFDEVPLASRILDNKTSYDWSSLDNKRPDEVTVVVSLQPLLLAATPRTKSRNVRGPKNADVIKLTRQYRNTLNISGFVNQLCRQEVPVEYAKVKISSSHDIEGPDVQVALLASHHHAGRLRVWLCNQLQQELACKPSQVKMIYVSNIEELAHMVAKDTPYEGCLTAINDFQGCETPVAVVFFSNAPDGDYSQLLEMCSRAQYKLFLVMYKNPALHDMITNIKAEISVVDIQHIDPQPAVLEAIRTGNAALLQQLLHCGASLKDHTEDGNSLLFAALIEEQTSQVRMLLEHGVSLEDRNSDGDTPLLLAAKLGSHDLCALLVDHSAQVDAFDKQGLTPLAISVQAGNVALVKLLLKAGANIDGAGKNGHTPLLLAAKLGYHQLCTVLLHYGAQVDVSDQQGLTPLMTAVQTGNITFVGQLLENGANVENCNIDGDTPLLLATKLGFNELCSLLIDKGARVNASNMLGLTPLISAIKTGNDGLVQKLLEHGATQTLYDENETLLHSAAKLGLNDVCSALLKHGADVNASDGEGINPLIIAVRTGNVDLVKQLLDHGAYVEGNTRENTRSGVNLLHTAASLGFHEVCTVLLEHGMNLEDATKKGNTPLLLATKKSHFKAVSVLLENGAKINVSDKDKLTPLLLATIRGDVSIMAKLLEHETSLGSGHSSTPSYDTDETNEIDIIKQLVECDIGLRMDENYDGHTFLTTAATLGFNRLCSVLIDHGSDANTPNKQGFTPLMIAAQLGNFELVKQLLKREADPTTCNPYGQTPLHLAAILGSNDVCALLASHGANLLFEDYEGNTPIMLAEENGHLSTLYLLKNVLLLGAGSGVCHHSSKVNCISWHPRQDVLASGSEDGNLTFWKHDQEQPEVKKFLSGITSLDWSTDGNFFAVSCREGEAAVWCGDFLVTELTGHSNWITKIKFSPNDDLVAGAGADQTCHVWEVETGERVSELNCGSDVYSLTWSEENKLAIGCGSGIIHLWKVRSQPRGSKTWKKWTRWAKTSGGGDDQTDRSIQLEGHSRSVNSLALNQNQTLLASGSSDEKVIVWKLHKNSPLQTLTVDSPVEEVKFSPSEAHLLASIDLRGEVRLWEAVSGVCVQVVQCENYLLGSNRYDKNYMNFSPNGRFLMCRGVQVKVFKVEAGTLSLQDASLNTGGEMVCWNSNSNKLAIVTYNNAESSEVTIFDL